MLVVTGAVVVVGVVVVEELVVGDTSAGAGTAPSALIAVTGWHVANMSSRARTSAVVNASDQRSFTEIQSTA